MKSTIGDNNSNFQKVPKSKNANVPDQPDWMFNRKYLTMDFVNDSEEIDNSEKSSLVNLTTRQQELLIIEDLLYCMEGVDGEYITAFPHKTKYSEREFHIDPVLNTSLTELTKRILPLCSYYSTIVRFIEEKSSLEYGKVNHALSAAM